MSNGILSIVIVYGLTILLAIPLARYISKIFSG
jgi:hypothetical protein